MPEEGAECFIAGSENQDAAEGSSFDRLIKIALLLKTYAAIVRNKLVLNTAWMTANGILKNRQLIEKVAAVF
jgi:hypothetical protein